MNLEYYTKLFTRQYEARRAYLFKNRIEAYRLFHSEYGEPSLAIDIYGESAVIHVFSPVADRVLETVQEALERTLGVRECFYKNRTKSEKKFPSRHRELIITEYGNRFLINLSDYLDTGLFLDHRETRRWLGGRCKGKIVLNTFAYTGSFSVYAGQGGAQKTVSVDLSKTYCEWIKKNLTLNKLPPEHHWVFKMDTAEFFRYAARKSLSFDIIVIDPPTFSRNKGRSFSVQKDHPQLLNEALRLLRPRGFILFSNNYREFSLKKRELSPCRIEEKLDTVPPDFDGLRPHRCFVLRAAR